jgi:excisionase family DNA binding protein
MDKVMILTTPDEIAEGLKRFLKEHSSKQSQPDFKDEKMTVSEASQFIDVAYPTLCKWINSGKIPTYGKGRKRFVLRTELIEAYKQMR